MSDGPETRFLCEVTIELDASAPIPVGASPWRNRRVSDIVGGRFEGPTLKGQVCRSGADWSEGGRAADGGIATALDVRSLWRTDDGAYLYVTYGGRLVIPVGRVTAFSDPDEVAVMDPGAYYFRTTPLFETSDERYRWLNEIVAVGMGRRTPSGVIYRVFQIM